MPRKAPAPSTLEIHLFGTFRVAVDGRPVEEQRWSRRKAKLLVKLLALERYHQLHREQIMERLWPELDPDLAANNLHKAIHAARHALEPGMASRGAKSHFVITRGQHVSLGAPHKLWIDVDEFEQRAAQALKVTNTDDYEAVLSLYEDDLLIEDPYEDWAEIRREQLRTLHHGLRIKLAGIYEAQGHYERSIEHLKELIAREPSDEEAHRRLMRLYALTGDKFRALEQYKQCRAALRTNLDAEPEQETVELSQKILSGGLQPSPSRGVETASPSFTQLTFRRGWIQSARFASGGQTIVYGAAWDGRPMELFSSHSASPEARSLGLSGAGLLAISSSGEMAVSLNHYFFSGYVSSGTLACVPLGGGAARELLQDVQWSDWSQDGAGLAIVRTVGGRSRLEYPIGNVLYETGGWIGHPRISPKGDVIAFLDHPTPADDGGSVMLVDLKGSKRTLSADWISAQGLAWSPSGAEVWFTATKAGNARAVHAVSLSGQERLIYRGAGSLTLHDIADDGRLLLTRDNTRLGIICLAPGEQTERDLSWHDWSLARDLSRDGRTLLFTEAGEGGGATYYVYLRRTDGSPAIRLGEGSALALSPDGKWALAKLITSPGSLALMPTGPGWPRLIEWSRIHYQPWACWLPDGKSILLAGNEAGRGTQLFVQELKGGVPRNITPDVEGVRLSSPHSISPDGRGVAVIAPDQEVYLYPLEGGEPERIASLEPGDMPVRWADDGRALYFRQRAELPAKICRLDGASGQKEAWKELMPPDPVGVHEILRVLLTPDGKCHAYTYTRDLSDLYILSGLR